MKTPLVGRMTSFANAHPDIENVEVEYKQTWFVYVQKPGESDIKKLTGVHDIQPIIPCCNEKCHDGGLNIEEIISIMADSKKAELVDQTRQCMGHEGRNAYDSCPNHFKYSIRITYKKDKKS
ncbi:hypothetical protein [Solidesulfovibrio sp. C21]|uniref:hypothetical protein n=1 Tax=Solidesulfovibrio sp. C21 TaxID=3398613 RepID=UPI0039FD27F5